MDTNRAAAAAIKCGLAVRTESPKVRHDTAAVDLKLTASTAAWAPPPLHSSRVGMSSARRSHTSSGLVAVIRSGDADLGVLGQRMMLVKAMKVRRYTCEMTGGV